MIKSLYSVFSALNVMFLIFVSSCTSLNELEVGSQSWDMTFCLRNEVQNLPSMLLSSDALANCLIRLVTKTDKTLESEERLKELGFDCTINLNRKRCNLVNRERTYGIGPFYTRGKDFQRRESVVMLTSIDNKITDLIVQEKISSSNENYTETTTSDNLIY